MDLTPLADYQRRPLDRIDYARVGQAAREAGMEVERYSFRLGTHLVPQQLPLVGVRWAVPNGHLAVIVVQGAPTLILSVMTVRQVAMPILNHNLLYQATQTFPIDGDPEQLADDYTTWLAGTLKEALSYL